jgi:hypothetical protein
MPTITIKDSTANKIEIMTNVMTITELSGRKRTITLSQTSLPKKGANWGIEQRLPTVFPPGAIEGSQQVLGPIPVDTTFEGVWRRTKLGRNPVVVDESGSETRIIYPETVRALIEDVVARGSLLQVTWQSITRNGRIARFNCPIDTRWDIHWEMTLKWVSFGPSFPERLVLTRSGGGTQALIDGLLLDSETLGVLDGATIAVDKKAKKSKGAPELTIGQVSAFLDGPNRLVQQLGRKVRELTGKLKAVADLATKFKQQPALITNTILATCENIVAQCNQFQDEYGRNPPEVSSYDTRVSSITNMVRYYAEANRLADALKEKAQALRDEQKRRAEALNETGVISDIIALHLVRDGDTLMSISQRYYGTPDNGSVIAKANGLKYPIFAAETTTGRPDIGGKTLLVIPVIRK